MTVGEMLSRMSSSEYSQWKQRDRFIPVGSQYHDWQYASIKALLKAYMTGNPQKIQDSLLFDLDVFESSRKQTPEDIEAIFRSLAGNKGKKS